MDRYVLGVLGVLALAAILPLGIIAVLQTVHGQRFDEPASLAALAGVAFTALYGHAVSIFNRRANGGGGSP